MIVAPYERGQPHDSFLTKIFKNEQKEIRDGEDDGLYILTGVVGTGKSTLGHHIITVLNPKPDIRFVPLTRQQFASSIKLVKDLYNQGQRNLYLQYDEAEANSRRAMSKWNNDVMRLYQTNRVFQCIHLWCNPNVKLLEKTFIEERIKGLFFTFTKETKRPRRYLFYPKRRLLDMIESGLPLTHHNLRKRAKKYAYYLGWFKKFEGDLVDEYKQHKVDSSSQIVDEFVEKWGENAGAKSVTAAKAARTLGIHENTVRRCVKELVDLKILDSSKVKTVTGRYKLEVPDLEAIRTHLGVKSGG